MTKIETVHCPRLKRGVGWVYLETTAEVIWEEKPRGIKITYLTDGALGKAGDVRYLDPWKVKRGFSTDGGANFVTYAVADPQGDAAEGCAPLSVSQAAVWGIE
jgi:hypothetical protein